ncbi:hypothetical protein PAXRUDRAFT_829686 [Paxillus rubicundulus Ve08.2h10]|uniref:Uncharacterized protein n=1 Tax=Paxillus rubicundulus Ve08.2h10 TaxID=930991 RepID=A0A0D0E5F9_9AGAM|nr:hypothetical protein PAXRUDRAFT_829686 [Paxillus rubicundulus Ve08.2h10]
MLIHESGPIQVRFEVARHLVQDLGIWALTSSCDRDELPCKTLAISYDQSFISRQLGINTSVEPRILHQLYIIAGGQKKKHQKKWNQEPWDTGILRLGETRGQRPRC